MTIGLIKYHLIVLFREPLNLFFGFALPYILLFVIVGNNDAADLPVILDLNLSYWLVIAVMVLAFMDSAFSHAYGRQIKFLRLLRMTPMTSNQYVLTGIFSRIGILLLYAASLILVMTIFFNMDIAGKNWLLFISVLLLTYIMFYFISMFIANLLKSAKRSQSLLYIVFFGLLLFGVWIPFEFLPNFINNISDYFPHISTINLLQNAWGGNNIFSGPYFITTTIYTVIFGILSIKFFKFD